MPKGKLYLAGTARIHALVLCKACAARSNEKLIEQPIGVDVMRFTETSGFREISQISVHYWRSGYPLNKTAQVLSKTHYFLLSELPERQKLDYVLIKRI